MLYLKCETCGEVFDSIETAQSHQNDCPLDFDQITFSIVTEEEAF